MISYEKFLTDINSFAAHIPLYLYPFLNTTSKSRPFEYLRLTSLGVIGALVKVLYPWFSCAYVCVCVYMNFPFLIGKVASLKVHGLNAYYFPCHRFDRLNTFSLLILTSKLSLSNLQNFVSLFCYLAIIVSDEALTCVICFPFRKCFD